VKGPQVALIAAMDREQVIGKDGELPWHLPNDLKRFKSLTTGHPILMGRKTYESIGRPLPNRRNLVLTRQVDYTAPGIEIVHSVEEALEKIQDEPWLFVIGGEEVYRMFIEQADRIHLTEVHTEVIGGDAFFPVLNLCEFVEVSRESHTPDEQHAFAYDFVDYAPSDSTC
jgi:dihydrofolate reductase